MVVVVADYCGSIINPTSGMLSDTRGLSYTRIADSIVGANTYGQAFFTAPVTSTGAYTIKFSSGCGYESLAVWEVSGHNTATPVLASITASGTGANPTTGNIVTTANSLILAFITQSSSAGVYTWTAGANYTKDSEGTDGSNIPFQAQHRTTVPTPPGTYTVNWIAQADNWQASVVAIREAPKTLNRPPNNLGLAVYLSMNEGTSTMVGDFSGNNNFGTTSNMSNPATASSGWTSGKHGGGLAFDGNNDYVTMSPKALAALKGGEYTISFWAKHNWQNGEFIMDTTNTGETQRFFMSLNGGNWAGNQKAISIGENGNTSGLGPVNSIPATGWSFITVTLSVTGNAAIGYVNGVQTGTSGNGYVADTFGGTGRTFIIGARYDTGTSLYNGKMDDLRIYNRVLSPAEIGNLYKSGQVTKNVSPTTRITNGLVGYWTFDGKDTDWGKNIAYDVSGNNNTGTLTNMSTTTTPVAGKFGQAFKFNGSTSYVDVGNISSLIGSNTTGTVSLWFSRNGNTFDPMFYWGQSANNQNLFSLIFDSGPPSGNMEVLLKTTVDLYRATVDLGSSASDGSWNNLVFSVSGSGNTLYYNGVAQTLSYTTGNSASSQWFNSISSEDKLTIGARTIIPTQYSSLKIDDVRLYNRALTATEAKQLYTMGTGKN
jgi:hypothetical protein